MLETPQLMHFNFSLIDLCVYLCSETDLDLVAEVLLVVRIQQVCDAIVGDLNGVITLQENISGSEVPVDHHVLLQVVHALRTSRRTGFSKRQNRPCQNPVLLSGHTQRSGLYLCYLNTPVEQPLWAEVVPAVLHVLQQGALIAELGDQLQTGAGANTQDPDHIDVVQASHCCHVLHGTLKLKSQSNDSL